MPSTAEKTNCHVEKCKGTVRAKGYCDRHYRAWRKGTLPKARYKICSQEGCKKPQVAFGQGYCQDHLDAWKAARKRTIRMLADQEKVAKAQETPPPSEPATPAEDTTTPPAA